MTGDIGPYVELDGPLVYVPRTVPYLRARRVAQEVNQDYSRLVYCGKADVLLIGFGRDCECEEVCEAGLDADGEPTDEAGCSRVPAWKFELVER